MGRRRLPAGGGDARRAVDTLYRHLVRLPWTSVRLVAEPVRGHSGRFYVGAVGEVGGADPADRIMARRVFDVALRGGRIVLLDDVTPRDVRGQGVMAFERPVAVRRNGLVVIADKSEQAGAEALARAGGPARERLSLLGITSRKPVRGLLLLLARPAGPLARRGSRTSRASASSRTRPDHLSETPTLDA